MPWKSWNFSDFPISKDLVLHNHSSDFKNFGHEINCFSKISRLEHVSCRFESTQRPSRVDKVEQIWIFSRFSPHPMLTNQWTVFLNFHWKKHTILKDFHGFSRNSTDSEILVLDDQASDSTKSKCSVKYGWCTFTVLRVFRNVFAPTHRHQHAHKTGKSTCTFPTL